MTMAYCPDCEEAIIFKAKPKLGQRFACPNCDSELEVINLSPLEIDWAYDEPEVDWEDDLEEEEWSEDDWEDDEDDEDL